MDISKFLAIADNLLTIVVLTGGTLAFFGRTWISEWIRNRFSKIIHKELETQKHQLNKELESYKGSLIRELEQFKANIDIKRSIALKMSEKRLDALQSLFYEIDRLNNVGVTWATLTTELRRHNLPEFNETVRTAMTANRNSAIFLPSALTHEISAYFSCLLAYTKESGAHESTSIIENPQDDPRVIEIFTKQSAIANQLRKHIYSTPAQLD